jgi:hypothetical protein
VAPLDFPNTASGVAGVKLAIERVDYAAPEASGRQGGVQAGWPLWSAAYSLETADAESADAWEAFVARLRGRSRTFLAGDPARPFPRKTPLGFAGLNRAGGGAFNGAALGWAQTFDADGNALIALTGLPAVFQLSPRDLIGFKWDAVGAPALSYHRRALVQVVVAAVASGGGAVTVSVEPPLDQLVVPAGAVAHLDSPAFVARQVPDKTSLGPIGKGGAGGAGTIYAMQDLRP